MISMPRMVLWRPAVPDSRPRTMVGPRCQGLVKQRIVAEKGWERRHLGVGSIGFARSWTWRGVHCESAGIVVREAGIHLRSRRTRGRGARWRGGGPAERETAAAAAGAA